MSEQDFIEKRAQDILKLILNSSEHSKITLEHSLVIKSIIAEALKQEREIATLEMESKLGDLARQICVYAESDPIVGRMDTSWSLYKQAKEYVESRRK